VVLHSRAAASLLVFFSLIGGGGEARAAEIETSVKQEVADAFAWAAPPEFAGYSFLGANEAILGRLTAEGRLIE